MNTFLQQAPYLRTQRKFPLDIKQLSEQVDIAYIDIANQVNLRTIGIFPTLFNAITGESWYLQGQPTKQQALRQVYTFESAGPIPHGLNFESITLFTKPSGSYFDGTNYNGVIYANSNPIANQVTFYIDPDNIIVIQNGTAPPIVSGVIILEWLSQF